MLQVNIPNNERQHMLIQEACNYGEITLKEESLFVLDRSLDQSHVNTWPNLHCIKAPRLKERVSSSEPCNTVAHPCMMITLHVSSNRP